MLKCCRFVKWARLWYNKDMNGGLPMAKFTIYLTVLLLTVSFGSAAYAKPKVGDNNTTPRGETPVEVPDERHHKEQDLKRKKIADALGLDKLQAERVMASIDKYDRIMNELMQSLKSDIKELAEAIKSKKDDIIQALVEKIEHKEKEVKAIKQKEMDDLKGLLTLEQQAKYMLYRMDIRKDIREMFSDKEKTKDKDKDKDKDKTKDKAKDKERDRHDTQ
jgi:Spy/CpxP family protein refolding chaperone